MSKKQNSELAIEISEIRFSWGNHHPILEIERLRINRGEQIFIEGPNGSGKSTLLSSIAGADWHWPVGEFLRASMMRYSALKLLRFWIITLWT